MFTSPPCQYHCQFVSLPVYSIHSALPSFFLSFFLSSSWLFCLLLLLLLLGCFVTIYIYIYIYIWFWCQSFSWRCKLLTTMTAIEIMWIIHDNSVEPYSAALVQSTLQSNTKLLCTIRLKCSNTHVVWHPARISMVVSYWILTSRQPHRVSLGRISYSEFFYTCLKQNKAQTFIILLHLSETEQGPDLHNSFTPVWNRTRPRALVQNQHTKIFVGCACVTSFERKFAPLCVGSVTPVENTSHKNRILFNLLLQCREPVWPSGKALGW